MLLLCPAPTTVTSPLCDLSGNVGNNDRPFGGLARSLLQITLVLRYSAFSIRKLQVGECGQPIVRILSDAFLDS